MKNKEKFKKEIVELACNGNGIAVDKYSGTVGSCNYVSCNNCLFMGIYYCDKVRREWAESEYAEKPMISKRDRAFLDYLKYYKYIAILMKENRLKSRNVSNIVLIQVLEMKKNNVAYCRC